MKLKDSLKYVARPAGIVTTVLILLIAVAMLQGIIIQTAMLWGMKSRAATMKPKKELSEEEKYLEKIRNSAKQFLPDGTIHLVYTPRDFPTVTFDDEKQEEIYDVNSNLLWSGLEKNRPYEYLSWSKVVARDVFAEWRMKQIHMITPEFSRSLEVPVRSQEKTEQVWRYDPRRQLFMGYRVDGGNIGYIGSTGFTDSKSQAKPFGRFKLFTAWCPEDSFSPTLLWQTSRRVYEINFEKQQVQLIFESTESNIKQIALHKWRAVRPKTPKDSKIPYRPLIKCLTEDGKHHLIMRNPDEKLTVTVGGDLWSEALSFTATTQDIFLLRPDTARRIPSAFQRSPKLTLEWLRKFRGKPYKKWLELYKVDNQGELHLLNRYDWTVPVRSGHVHVVEADLPWIKAKHYACQFSTPLYDLAWYLLVGSEFRAYSYRDNDFISAFADLTREFRPGNSILNWLLALAMMGFAFWHGWPRRTSRAKFVFWLVFVGAFNLLGLLTYLALNHTALIKCRACGRRRGLAQVNCARCGVELPAPERGKLDLISNN